MSASHAEVGMALAIAEARRFEGATAPNPPVGAVALDARGEVLAVAAHELAGEPHAEAALIALCRKRGIEARIHTVVVTLEPCNHSGRTPPCADALLALPALARVVIGALDPNPRVEGGGARRLRDAGIDVVVGVRDDECQRLIRPFAHWAKTGLPWVTMKIARRADGGMIPPPGQTTFTSPEQLKVAHELRRRAGAILTGSGTVLADRPQFTVRHVPDHPRRPKRWIVVLDRRGRVAREAPDWVKTKESQGFLVRTETGADALGQALRFLGQQGVIEVLVEAGPTLAKAIADGGISNETVVHTAD